MSKLEKTYELQELLDFVTFLKAKRSRQAMLLHNLRLNIVDDLEDVWEVEGLNTKLQQLVFYFDAELSPEDIVFYLDEVHHCLTTIIEAERAGPPEIFSLKESTKTGVLTSAFVPKQVLEYWQKEAEEAAENKEDIKRLVRHRIAAWIAGLKEQYAKEHKIEPTPEDLVDYLESQNKKIGSLLNEDEKKIHKILSPFEKSLSKSLSKAIFQKAPHVPKETIKNLAIKIASLLSKMPEILDPKVFQIKLDEILEASIDQIESLKGLLSHQEFLILVKSLLKFHKLFSRSLNLRGEQYSRIGRYSDVISATNFSLQEPPEGVEEKEWRGFRSWWNTLGYPGQTLVALMKSEPGIFKGAAQEMIKNVTEALVPGLPTRGQLMMIFSAGKKQLTGWKLLAIKGSYEIIYGIGSFGKAYQGYLKGRPDTFERQVQFATELSPELKHDLDLIQEGFPIKGRKLTFEQREKLSRHVLLLNKIEKREEFRKKHPFLADASRIASFLYALPIRYQKLYLFYQLSKFGPYAPAILVNFLIRELGYMVARTVIVKLTSRFAWGWKIKHVPFVGDKVVWKPLEKLKDKGKEVLEKVFKKVLGEKLVKKIIVIIAGGGVVGSLIIIFKKPIEKILKGIGTLILHLLVLAAHYGTGALAFVGASTLVGSGVGMVVGYKIGGILGGLVGGPVGAFVGGLASMGLVYLWVNKVQPFFASLSGPTGAEVTTELTSGVVKAATPVSAFSLAGTVFLTTATIILVASTFFFYPKEYEPLAGSRYIKIIKGVDVAGHDDPTNIPNSVIGGHLVYNFTVNCQEAGLTNIVIKEKTTITGDWGAGTETSLIQRFASLDNVECTHWSGEKCLSYTFTTQPTPTTWTIDAMSPGQSWRSPLYGIEHMPSEFQNTLITNTITVTADGPNPEKEEQSITLSFSIGNPPIPETAKFANDLLTALISCYGDRITESAYDGNGHCLSTKGVPNSAISEITNSIGKYQALQCVGFARAVAAGTGHPLTSFSGHAKDYAHDGDGYRWLSSSLMNTIQPGDIFILTAGEWGHMGVVTSLLPGNGFILAEAWGVDGEGKPEGHARWKEYGFVFLEDNYNGNFGFLRL